jgi:geranylgeranyl diphosphate synthase type 3
VYNLHFRIDDIEDNSLLRGGIPAAHSIFGVANTISASNYEFFKSLKSVLSLQHSEAMKIYIELLLDASRGQALDIYWRENYICPLVEEYQEMIKGSKNRFSVMGRFNWICALY